ncbi:MAG TPA: deoxyribodipyrimidine photo-lyase [Holophagaceae bacterium]|nr:deoxyribodipyrimidine photo-lyase [Holophagaceae bacterium]
MADLQIVWFKRDLRLQDHAPLRQAAEAGPVVPVYAFEPSQLRHPDASARHAGFVLECLAELERDLADRGLKLLVWRGELVDLLTAIRRQAPIGGLWSHEETGHLASYARDRAVAAWCRDHGVPWTELPQMGVVRRLGSRDGWARRWEAFMSEPLAAVPDRMEPGRLRLEGDFPELRELGFADGDAPRRQPGGRQAGRRILEAFLAERAAQYRGCLSSPLKAATGSSRLSPYLAWGAVSLREVVQASRTRRRELREDPLDRGRARELASLAAFESRLHWHCHFIQKLESEPELERRNVHRGYDGLREDAFDPARFEAWRRGETGFPLLDACMARLRETGWINFRMRAMLMSVAAHHLWLHWPEPARHLAGLFLDYEPGIHYPQAQMQAGVTGINALRIYNPVKQARDQDPEGRFVRQWLPALRRVPDAYLFEPWRMPPELQSRCGVRLGRDYPSPVVDLGESLRLARARYQAWRRRPGLREESARVLRRHGSRGNPDRIPERRPLRDPAQPCLFGPAELEA